MDHFMPVLEKAALRMPVLEHTGIQTWFNGPESFTPDDRYLLGETAEVKDLFVACGFNSIGIQSSGGAGKVLAEWIRDRRPPMDLVDIDVRRMNPFQGTKQYLHDRTVETLGLLYKTHWPFYQYTTARGARRTHFHERLQAEGAVYGELAGWERPNWFAPPGTPRAYAYSYGKQNWFEHTAAECRATRDAVALYDQSTMTKFMVEGRDALRVLETLSANRIDVAPGKVVYTQWLNEQGGIEADLTITRTCERQFMVVSAAARGCGAGRAIVDAVLADLRATPGMLTVRLTVTDGNRIAERLYARCGFVRIGLEPMAVRVDDGFIAKATMWRRLDEDIARPTADR
jgi:4-methylaminobutanoate oxidase (formaldehyde-forming)